MILICIPLTVPPLLDYQPYAVISGSMEPAIPTGSLVYIKGMEAQDVQEGDVIAFYGGYDSSAIVTHRVVENRVVMGEYSGAGNHRSGADQCAGKNRGSLHDWAGGGFAFAGSCV